MARSSKDGISELPLELQIVRTAALKALAAVEPAGPPKSDLEARGLWLSSRTTGGRRLPEYYLVYFLLVDLLGFPFMGREEKSAWTVPIRYRGRLYGVEHRKMGLGIFAPTLDAKARMSAPASEEAEADAVEIAALIAKAVKAAEPYFEWRAEQAASSSQLNVINNSIWLFERYEHFRDRFTHLTKAAEDQKNKRSVTSDVTKGGMIFSTVEFPSYTLRREAEWNGQAAVEAFFSWTEHVFIHLAILQGQLRHGDDVANLAAADWKAKFKAALSISDGETKKHYDTLLDLRAQVRNFMAHGAFGKRGEAFHFHSGAGAVPLLLVEGQKHRYSLTGLSPFDEISAIQAIERFINHLWSSTRLPAKHYIFSGLPSILTLAGDGTYARCMQSESEMKKFVERMTWQFDNAANMDW